MRIKMKATRDGADDGFTVREYEQDCFYDVSENLGKCFIQGGYAEAVAEEAPAEIKAADPNAPAENAGETPAQPAVEPVKVSKAKPKK
jgi:hypothetical protein